MFKTYALPHIRRILINAVIKMSGTVLEVLLPTIMAFIIDTIVPRRDRNAIILWGVIMILASLGAWIGNVTANRMASRTAAIAIRSIRSDLFARAMQLSARQLDRMTISSLESRLTTDTYNIHSLFGSALRLGIRSVMLFLGGIIFCFILSWRLALILLLLIPPLVITVRRILGKGIPLFQALQLKIDLMVQVIRENIRGIRVSKALDKTTYEQQRFQESNYAVRDADKKALFTMAWMSPLVNIILYGGLCIVLIVGANLTNNGIVQAGTIMAFMTYVIQITNSLLSMNRMFDIYNRATASIDRVNEVLNTPADTNQLVEGEAMTLPEPSAAVPEIEFRHVSFSYMGKIDDVNDISFKIYPGETLGIMGATGAGKSTLIRLLSRQYDPTEGEILIRGINIKKLDPKALHRLFGSVFQNDFLFGSTLRANISFGRELTDDELMFAVRSAQAAEFIENKEGGLKYPLASKGANLSGGQKQRVLLSRALAGAPQILILDDSSSALDFRTDSLLRRALRDHFADTTSLIIAQRVSSIRHAEHILFLDNGYAVAYGTHDDLLQSCAPYREIAQTQMGDADLDNEWETVTSDNTEKEGAHA